MSSIETEYETEQMYQSKIFDFDYVKVEDAKWAVPLLEANGYMSCEYAFVDVYIWKRVANTLIARYEDFVILRSDYDGKTIFYQFPAGTGDLKKAIDAILENAKGDDKPPVITSIPLPELERLEGLYPGYFDITNPRDASDYVYLSSDLADLPGRKYQKKRNHCSRFERTYPDWQFHEINDSSLEKVCEFNSYWATLYENKDDSGVQMEQVAVEQACRHYEELRLKGGYITVGGEVVAFSFGSPLGDEFVTHVEKANYDISGAYNMINREMARAFGRKYTYINRENDVGDEGLRTAKLSYHPTLLLDKLRATPKVWPPKD